LRSCWKIAVQAPISNVSSPAPPTSASHIGVSAKIGQKRIRMKTPAFTRVAEWR
jgi:hypothetical protein